MISAFFWLLSSLLISVMALDPSDISGLAFVSPSSDNYLITLDTPLTISWTADPNEDQVCVALFNIDYSNCLMLTCIPVREGTSTTFTFPSSAAAGSYRLQLSQCEKVLNLNLLAMSTTPTSSLSLPPQDIVTVAPTASASASGLSIVAPTGAVVAGQPFTFQWEGPAVAGCTENCISVVNTQSQEIFKTCQPISAGNEFIYTFATGTSGMYFLSVTQCSQIVSKWVNVVLSTSTTTAVTPATGTATGISSELTLSYPNGVTVELNKPIEVIYTYVDDNCAVCFQLVSPNIGPLNSYCLNYRTGGRYVMRIPASAGPGLYTFTVSQCTGSVTAYINVVEPTCTAITANPLVSTQLITFTSDWVQTKTFQGGTSMILSTDLTTDIVTVPYTQETVIVETVVSVGWAF